MFEPWWKRLLSYLFEWHIESASSEYNPHLYVSLRYGRYQLSTAHAVYSYADLYENFVQAFRLTELDRLPGDRVLVLGFGLGSIPFILEHTLKRHYRYTALEIDEAVLALASKYTLPALEAPLELICADAFTFLEQTTETYDLICMDIFLDDTVPEAFESKTFLERLDEVLSPGGLLLYNRLAANKKDIRRTHDFYREQFLPVFPDGAYLDVGGNWILLNRKAFLLHN